MQTQLVKQAKHYGSVRERLMNPKASIKREDFDRSQSEINALKAKIDGLTSELSMKAQEMHRLELDVADRNARILALAEELAKLDIAGVNADPKKTVASIVSEVLRDYPGVTWEDITGLRRTRELITPRHLCMVAIFEQRKDLSLPMIGRIFKRDHSTILAATRKYGIEGAGKSVLKDDKIQEIHNLMDTGSSYNDIARKVGCSAASVGRYIKMAKGEA